MKVYLICLFVALAVVAEPKPKNEDTSLLSIWPVTLEPLPDEMSLPVSDSSKECTSAYYKEDIACLDPLSEQMISGAFHSVIEAKESEKAACLKKYNLKAIHYLILSDGTECYTYAVNSQICLKRKDQWFLFQRQSGKSCANQSYH